MIREDGWLAPTGCLNQQVLEAFDCLRVCSRIALHGVRAGFAAGTELIHRDPRAAAVLPQSIPGIEGVQHSVAALHGALKVAMGNAIWCECSH
jgi:hypothetical protein